MKLLNIIILLLLLNACSNTNNENSTTAYDPSVRKNYNANQLLQLHNTARQRGDYCGSRKMKPSEDLTWSTKLTTAANRHSLDMAINQFFGHIGSDNSNTKQRINASGYQWKKYGENLAHRQPTPEIVFTAWLSKAEHCRNILDRDFNEMGAAVVNGYWTVVFGTKR